MCDSTRTNGRRPECALLRRLSPDLYGYEPAALDFDVQVVPVEHQHTHERSAARGDGTIAASVRKMVICNPNRNAFEWEDV